MDEPDVVDLAVWNAWFFSDQWTEFVEVVFPFSRIMFEKQAVPAEPGTFFLSGPCRFGAVVKNFVGNDRFSIVNNVSF